MCLKFKIVVKNHEKIGEHIIISENFMWKYHVNFESISNTFPDFARMRRQVICKWELRTKTHDPGPPGVQLGTGDPLTSRTCRRMSCVTLQGILDSLADLAVEIDIPSVKFTLKLIGRKTKKTPESGPRKTTCRWPRYCRSPQSPLPSQSHCRY